MIKNHIKGFSLMVLLNFIAFITQYFFVNNFMNTEEIPVLSLEISYLINMVASISVCLGVLALQKKFETQIGFLFLGLSVVKMILLFILINPTNETGDVTKIDTLAFFIPFALNLIMEQVFIAKLLKISDLGKILKK